MGGVPKRIRLVPECQSGPACFREDKVVSYARYKLSVFLYPINSISFHNFHSFFFLSSSLCSLY